MTRRFLLLLAVAFMATGCSLVTVGDVPPSGEPSGWRTVLTPRLNGDGRIMMFMRAAPIVDLSGVTQVDVFVRNLVTKQTQMVSVNNAGAELPGITYARDIDASGNRVMFETRAAVVPADTNNHEDLYLRDIAAGTTTLVTVDPAGKPFPSSGSPTGGQISNDGTRVAFGILDVINPAHAYVRDLTTGTTTDLGVADAQFVQMSHDGRHFVVYPKGPLDYNKAPVFIDPPGSGYATRPFCDGVNAAPLSADGRISLVSIFSAATCPGITGFQLWDRVTDVLTPIVPAAPTTDPNRFYVSSADDTARFIALTDATVSAARVDVLDRKTGATRTISVGPHGEPANAGSTGGSISRDGRRIAFWSEATNLVDPAATTGHAYVKDVVVPALQTVSPAAIPRASTATVTFKGSGFNQPFVVFVIDGVTPTSVHVVDERTITATVAVAANASIGPRNVWLLQGSSSTLCAGCLAVT